MKNALTTLSLTAMAVTTLISGCASKPPMPEIGETFFETKNGNKFQKISKKFFSWFFFFKLPT